MNAGMGRWTLAAALVGSLALHLSAFGLVHGIRNWGGLPVTQARADESPRRPETSPPPEEDEIKLGIEDGAPAVVTWIGYDEYKEHLARLAETEQAAFTSAIARGTPEAMSTEQAPPQQAPPLQTPTQVAEVQPPAAPVQSETTPAAPEETASSPAAQEEPTPAEAAPFDSFPLPPAPAERLVPQPRDVEPQPRQPDPQPQEEPIDKPDEQRESPAPSQQPDERPLEQPQADSEPVIEPDPTLTPTTAPSPLPGVSPMPVSSPQGEPTPLDSTQSSKDSPATSTKQVPESKWDNGKPLAAEGLELRPYSLYRHISWDSHDVMFAQQLNRGRWEGRVVRNPIVSMRFDRHGRVGEARIIRPSGYGPLDQMYLKSWIARWTAAGERLAQLKAEELTAPIQMKIVFIDEPPPKTDKSGDPNEGS